jgi:hypothetical protein
MRRNVTNPWSDVAPAHRPQVSGSGRRRYLCAPDERPRGAVILGLIRKPGPNDRDDITMEPSGEAMMIRSREIRATFWG